MVDTVSQAEVESQILRVLRDHAQGLTDDDLERLLTPIGVSSQGRLDGINGLIQRSRLNVLQRPDGTALFRIVSEEHAMKMRDLSYEEQLIY